MPVDRRREFSSFVWAVGREGRQPKQVRDEVRATVGTAVQHWRRAFPPEQGYEVSVVSPAGPSNGVVLGVARGDFQASVSVESFLDPNRRAPQDQTVRMFGRAESKLLARIDQQGPRAVQHFQRAGVSFGALAFASVLWFSMGAHPSAILLAGLIMVVAALVATTLGSSVGGYVGETLLGLARVHAQGRSSVDPALHEDLRRWRGLARNLEAQRGALVGKTRAAPFRISSATATATSSFSS